MKRFILLISCLSFFHASFANDDYTIVGTTFNPCSGATCSYSVQPENVGDTYSWSTPDGEIDDPTLIEISVTWDPNNTANINETSISVVITNQFGIDTTITKEVFVFPEPNIQPEGLLNVRIVQGQVWKFSVAAVGGDDLTYTWMVQGDGEWYPITQPGIEPNYSGYNTHELTVTDAPCNTYMYKCKIESCGEEDFSEVFTLIVKPQPTITLLTPEVNVCQNGTAELVISSTNADTLQWFKGALPLQDGLHFEGVDNDTLIIKNALLSYNGDEFTCRATSYSHFQNIVLSSDPTSVHVHREPVISGDILVSGDCPNSPVTLQVNSVENVLYNWVVLGDTIHDTTNAIEQIISENGLIEVYAVSIFGCGTSDTLSADFTTGIVDSVKIEPLIITEAGQNGKATIEIEAAGRELVYQWLCLTSDTSLWIQIDETSTYPKYEIQGPVLNISNVTSRYNGYKYRCVIHGTCASDTSEISTLRQNNQIISLTASETEICENTPITLTANTELNMEFEWYRNGEKVPGQTLNVFQDSPETTSTYAVVATAGDFKDSIPISITVNPLPGLELVTNSDQVCRNERGILIYSNNDTENYSYDWNVNNDEAHMVDSTQRYFIVDAGTQALSITLKVQNNETTCSKIYNKSIIPHYPESIASEAPTWKMKGDYILLYSFSDYNQPIEWGTTDLDDFSEDYLVSDTGYHDFYPNAIDISNYLYWIEIPSESCNSRFYYGIEMTSQTKSAIAEGETVFPNPASDDCYFKLPRDLKSFCTVFYYNSGGSLIKTNSVIAGAGLVHDDISMLQSGVYFIRLMDEEGRSANYKLFVK